ncbi:MAG: hypothetical protein KGN01_03785 [Patescibacteria group bacterium]|nr:hypothetical protein [Patescibacteria group bacterium]
MELLVTIGIGTILIALLPISFSGAYQDYLLTSERNMIVFTLQKARNEAMSNFDQSDHGVYIQQNAYTVFQGTSYASRNPAYDEIFPASGGVAKTGLSEIDFDQLTGGTAASGTITLTTAQKSLLISINPAGQITW